MRSCVFALVVFFLSVARAEFTVPEFTSNVIDQAGVLSAHDVGQLHEKITELQRTAGIMPAILIVNSLGGESIEKVSNQSFHQFALGSKENDNGILLVLAPTERKMRIEVGYGLEGSITDVDSHHVVDDVMKPAFRQSEFGRGFLEALDEIKRLRLRSESEMAKEQSRSGFGSFGRQGDWVVAGILFIVNTVLTIGSIVLRKRTLKPASGFASFIALLVGAVSAGLYFKLGTSSPIGPFVVGFSNLLVSQFVLSFFSGLDLGGGSSSSPSSSSWSDSPSSSDWSSSSSSDSSFSSSDSSSGGGDSGGGGSSGDY